MFIFLTVGSNEEINATVISKSDQPASVTKKVCRDIVTKDKKIKKQCKNIKVHKKFEGTKVPEKVKK